MIESVSRRDFIRIGASAVGVFGFDLNSRNWVTNAHAATAVPKLDGTLATDPSLIEPTADDYGHIVARYPVAVLQPGSIEDVVRMVRYARRHRIPIAMRGQGHSSFGQAQVDGGIVVDSSFLSTVHHVGDDFAYVDAGVLWSQLFDATAQRGLMPPVLTDYLGLSVGGTLSVGGIGGAVQHYGLQADNVVELEVVTGRGRLVRCSPLVRRELFDAVLAGLGQFGLIVRAKVKLVPAQSQALVFNLFYDDLSAYVADQLRLLDSGRFAYLEGQAIAREDGSGWRYMVEAVAYFTPPQQPDQEALLSGLNDDRGSAVATVQTVRDFAFRLDPLIEYLRQIGVWGFPHPGLSAWVPATQAVSFLSGALSKLSVEQTGGGAVLIYPIKTRRVRRPVYCLPDEPVAFAFNILRIAPPDPEVVAQRLEENSVIYDELAAIGGTRYPIDAVPFSDADWKRQYGRRWRRLARAKRRFDPLGILTPGQGIFS